MRFMYCEHRRASRQWVLYLAFAMFLSSSLVDNLLNLAIYVLNKIIYKRHMNENPNINYDVDSYEIEHIYSGSKLWSPCQSLLPDWWRD